MTRPAILLVDDEPSILSTLTRALEDEYDCKTASGGAAARTLFENGDFACVISDQRMPGESGAEFLAWVRKQAPDATRILLTGYSDFDSLVAAVNDGGIHHFLPKPWEPAHLLTVVRQGAERFGLIRENQRLQVELRGRNEVLERENIGLKAESIKEHAAFKGLIGSSPAMQGLKKTLEALLPTQSTVLILGESGTGKELCARALHFGGTRREKIFVAQNCAALPDSILESELFGHVKGAFTHAIDSKVGILETASGGTLFLDEVGDMSLSMQARLLRFLQEGVVTPVGARTERKVDVRVIAATHRDLEAMVAEKTFREDLFYRLSVVPLHVPPLRERREDIALLAKFFLENKSKKLGRAAPALSVEALAVAMAHPFPGNVRELENAVEHALVFAANSQVVGPEHWPERMRRNVATVGAIAMPVSGTGFVPGLSLDDAVAQLERDWIQKALSESGGNITQAARVLGLSRQGLHNKLARYGLKAEE